MSQSRFIPKNLSFRNLLGNGALYVVPLYQRDYSWEQQQWEDLWLDMLDVLHDKITEHYLGYLVLHQPDGLGEKYTIIDGQQRITTFCLLVLAACRLLLELEETEGDEAAKRRELLMATYIGSENVVTLSKTTKLELNRNNNSIYQNYLAALKVPPKRRIHTSSRRMSRAQEWFTQSLQQRNWTSKELATFVEATANRMFFTVIYVPDMLDAYRVFETLNARGVQLSSADLLKNRLYALAHESGDEALEKMSEQWNELTDRLQGQDLVKYVRDLLLSQGEEIRKKELYRHIQKSIKDAKSAFGFVNLLATEAETWLNLEEPNAESGWSREWVHQAYLLRKVLKVRQPIPLLMAAKRHSDEMFTRLLKAVIIISIRYNRIGRMPPSEQERLYSAAARALKPTKSTKKLRPQHVIRLLKPMYPDDEAFITSFASTQIEPTSHNRTFIRFLLYALASKDWMTQANISANDPTIEHLLPTNPGDRWQGLTKHQVDEVSQRLGNLTLLERSLNHKIGNAEWPEKRKLLRQSARKENTVLADQYPTWSGESVNARQLEMGQEAARLWRLEELS